MNFFTPRKVHFGWGSVENLSTLNGKIVVITGRNLWRHVGDFVPFGDEVFKMSRAGEPTERDVMEVANFLKEREAEWILAVGGGSVIDSAKLAWVFYENPHMTWDKIYRREIPQLRRKARFAAVETTSGTGTGISAAAVVTDGEGLKHGVVSEHFIPDVSIYDPDLVMSMPEKTVIYSGMDALTHAIESYVSSVDNIAADTLSLKAVELIFNNIKSSREGIEESRALVHYGNMLAAMGFTNSRLGLCHAASHKIGGRLKIEHGKLNAILLPHFIRATTAKTRRYEDVERVLGIEDLASAIEELNEDFGIPSHIPGIANMITKIADEIMEDPLMRTNPGKMNREEVVEFLKGVAGV